MHMASIKEAALKSIRDLPDECTAEDIMYHVYFLSQVLEGLNDVEEGRVITTDELLQRVKQWAK